MLPKWHAIDLTISKRIASIGHSPQGYYKDTVEFYFEDRNQCKNFWKKCVEHHTFFRCSRSSYGAKDRERTRLLSRGSSFR